MFKHPPKLTQISKFVLVMLIFVTLCSAAQETKTEEDTEMKKEKIQIYPANPRYWQYKGETDAAHRRLSRGQSISDSDSQSASRTAEVGRWQLCAVYDELG